MRSVRLSLLLAFAPALVMGLAATSPAATAPSVRQQTLFFDAAYTSQHSTGPDSSHVGHEQIASGILRDAGDRVVGRFAFTCTWTRILPGGDALEHCNAAGRTADGQLALAGQARESDITHTWTITDGSGAYRGAHGSALVRDLSAAETLIAATVGPRSTVILRAGVISRPSVNTSFIGRANQLCAQAATRLAALPPFPLANFDPLHPDPKLLPQIGAFFTGRGDPRPILRTLGERLRALGAPAANGDAWTRTLQAGAAALAVRTRQDEAALAANVRAFVTSVHQTTRAFRQVAISATVFGAVGCVL